MKAKGHFSPKTQCLPAEKKKKAGEILMTMLIKTLFAESTKDKNPRSKSKTSKETQVRVTSPLLQSTQICP